MMDYQHRFIKNYPCARHMLRHKDAVTVCVRLLEKYTNEDVNLEILKEICKKFEDVCFIGSNKWEANK